MGSMRDRGWIGLVMLGWCGVVKAVAAEPAADLAALERDVQTILTQHCQDCHSSDAPEAQLDVTSFEKLLYGSVSGRILVPGDAQASLLLKLVAPESKPHMPPEGQLAPAEIATLAAWVNRVTPDRVPDRKLAGSADHWAYRPLAAHGLPEVQTAGWGRTPVDQFILAGLESVGLQPAPLADAAALCRRLYFDLIGLPPTPEQLASFVAGQADPATADAAYLAVVDQLLASPHYGERWGRHWLDLARYADSSGFHSDLDRPFAWRYRDYVIQSFNDDKPLAEFIIEQLAGDEYRPEQPDAWIATGFCRSGPTNDDNMGEGLAKEKYRLDLLDDVISTSSAVFLGQTVGCARCHDHKFDPIAQADYYRMLAVFDNTRRVNMGLSAEGIPVEPPAKNKADQPNQPVAMFMALTEATGKPRTTRLLWRGDAANPGPTVEPGVPAAFSHVPFVWSPGSTAAGTQGRRLAFAQWVASSENPLTYRVAANRIWQHLFGTGIVATPSNFGRTGAEPTHPELLDWLARYMLEHEGRWKPVQRLLVTSSAYRQSTKAAESLLVDPANRWVGRMSQRRLEAEILRDAVLAVSGAINLDMGGPGVKPRIRPELLEASQRNKWPVVKEDGPAQWRRSVYIYVKRQLPFPMLELFDAPSTAQTCECRAESVVPTQALVLMNDDFSQQQAGLFAARVTREAGESRTAQVALAIRLAFSREPVAGETAEGIEFLEQQAATYARSGLSAAEADRQALLDLCHVLFNCNEFAYLN